MNVRTHTRWMRSSPSPSPSLNTSPGRRCHFYRGPLGQPDTVRTRTVSDARHASDTDEYQPRSIRRVSEKAQIPKKRGTYIYHRVDRPISRDEPDSPLTQYITNAGISLARYTITHFKHHHRVLRRISNRISV